MNEWKPPKDASAERKKKNEENEALEETNYKSGNGEEDNRPPIPKFNPAYAKHTKIEDCSDEEDDDEDKPKRGRPKTISAKKACAKSMIIILNKLRKIHDITLQDEVSMLAEDAILELKHLHDIIDSVL